MWKQISKIILNWGTKAWVSNKIRDLSSPCYQRWMLKANRFLNVSVSIPPGDYDCKIKT
jgi:hypothetical protein